MMNTHFSAARLFRILAAVFFGLYHLSAQVANSPSASSADSISSVLVRPGVVHKKVLEPRGPWRINILEIDLTRQDLEIESARAYDKLFGREQTSSIARRKRDSRYEVIAALNADFFSLKTGENENNQIIDGEFVKGTKLTGSPFDTFDNIHSQFGISFDKKPLIDRFQFEGSVIWKNGSMESIHGVNDTPVSNALILFNSYYGNSTPADTLNMNIFEAELSLIGRRADTILATISGVWKKGGGSRLAEKTVVLSAYDYPERDVTSTTKLGDTVKIWLSLKPFRTRVEALVGGWPRIVTNGKNVAAGADSVEGTFPRFSANRHPRSGVGFSKDSTKVYFVTVDGRQQLSVGMSLVEFANRMISAGVYQGLNLDGGGSTTLVINGSIVNAPSDLTGERPIANCLLLMSRKQ